MMFRNLFLLALQLFLFTGLLGIPISSYSKEFQLKTGKISVEVPAKWQEAKDLFGVQLMLLAPQKYEHRPVFLLESTSMGELKLDSVALEKNYQEYKSGREAWVSKMGGKVTAFSSYRKQQLSNLRWAIVLGYEYELGAIHFFEKSYFVECNNNLYNFKTLVRAEEEKQYSDVFDKIIHSFSCDVKKK